MLRTKSKRLLSTRNNYTGKAINNLDNTSIKQLLIDNDSIYLEYDNKYIQRRFHGNDYLSQIKQKNKLKVTQDNKNKNNDSLLTPRSLEKVINDKEKHETFIQERFDKFSNIHNGEKPLLILDIDNTMLYARFFSDEMRINDIVTYFDNKYVVKNNAKVIEIQKTLNLEIIDGTLIDKIGKESVEISLSIHDNDTLQVLNYYLKNTIYSKHFCIQIKYIIDQLHRNAKKVKHIIINQMIMIKPFNVKY